MKYSILIAVMILFSRSTIGNEDKPSGSYENEFPNKGQSVSERETLNLSTGVYLFRIETNKFSKTKNLYY